MTLPSLPVYSALYWRPRQIFVFRPKIKSLAMYAVLKTGGKQYKVSQNDVIIVERLSGESGAKINLDNVLMIGDGENTTVGTPIIEGALVAAEVLEHKRLP